MGDVIPRIALHDNTTIPQLGFGTYKVPPEETAEAVGHALELGYRHIDTAQMYGNERGVGQAIAKSGIAREELYVTSKLNNDKHHPDDVRSSFDETLDELGVDYLDLFLMHWPLPTRYEGDYVSTWRAMAELLADGRLRSVGVSNFQPEHLDRIVDETGIVPVVNQIEVHPHFRNEAARAATARHGAVVEAWAPLGQATVLDDEVVGRIAAARGKAPSQIILRWHIERGDVIFPKSVHRERVASNAALFDFELSAEEIAEIDALDKGANGRVGPNPDTFDRIP